MGNRCVQADAAVWAEVDLAAPGEPDGVRNLAERRLALQALHALNQEDCHTKGEQTVTLLIFRRIGTLSSVAAIRYRARAWPPRPKERGPRKKAAPDFTLYAPLRAEQIRSNTSRASAIDSKEGCGFRPTLDPLPE